MTGQADYAIYNAWKAAAAPLKTMAVELVGGGLRATSLCSTHIETSRNSAIAGDLGGRHFADAMQAENISLGEAGGLRKWSARTSSSIDQASLITTSELAVDGSYIATM
jgi:NAD(P)-dependent dehydrogenase (short-subunit alcohol dehydrogenase family)